MTYKLLTFNQDWADEHNVPALACFNQEEYKSWLNSSIGTINKKYQEHLLKYDINEEKRKLFNEEWAKRREGKTWKSHPITGDDDDSKWYNSNLIAQTYKPTLLTKCYIYANLNTGNEFGNSFLNYTSYQDLIDVDIIKVTEVTEEFYKIFHEANLDNLSLCNVFEVKDYYDEDQD